MKTALKRSESPCVAVRPVWVEEWTTWVLKVEHCPYCGCQHRHGGGDDWHKQIGTRRDASCLRGGTYVLTTTWGSEIEPRRRRRGKR
jgi:hypothetical protein